MAADSSLSAVANLLSFCVTELPTPHEQLFKDTNAPIPTTEDRNQLEKTHLATLEPLANLAFSLGIDKHRDVVHAFRRILNVVGHQTDFLPAREQLKRYLIARKRMSFEQAKPMRNSIWWLGAVSSGNGTD